MLQLIYFIIIFLATCIGFLCGIGGGVIIKPALDALNVHSLSTIGLYPASALFTMSMVSLYKQLNQKESVFLTTTHFLSLGTGGIIGGFFGNHLFDSLLTYFANEQVVNLIQIITMIILLSTAVVYTEYFRHLTLNWRPQPIILFGLTFILGGLSALLSIGGGPINVFVFMLVFGLNTKEAGIYSLMTILFSQAIKVLVAIISGAWLTVDFSFILFIIPAAILGGFVGSLLKKQMSIHHAKIIYQLVTIGIILQNVWNGIQLIH